MKDLLEAQRLLQAEADTLIFDLQLEDLLGTVGFPVRVGSSAMALMLRRDVDITVICRSSMPARLRCSPMWPVGSCGAP